MLRTTCPLALATLATMLMLLCGCGSNPEGKLIPVSGKVTYEGKALPRGNVSFRPDKAGGNKAEFEPYGDIGADGTYSLFTNKKPGAPAGKYTVLVTAYEPIDPKNESATPKSLIGKKYGDPDLPLIQIEVVEGAEAGRYDLKLVK